MYEFGGGVVIDLERAAKNYEKAVNNGFGEKAKKRLENCRAKQAKDVEEQSADKYYQPKESYAPIIQVVETKPANDGCFAPGTRILTSDGTYKCVENIKEGDRILAYDHYKGAVCEEVILANVHDISTKKEYKTIFLHFEKEISLSIVKSHALFDMTDNKYVWIDDCNVQEYIGHKFAFCSDGSIESVRLLQYRVETGFTNYYMPLSRYHLNVFAEGILTMPPTKLTVNLFDVGADMRYDLSVVEKTGKTSYDDIKNIVSFEEYSALPCEYLAGVMYLKKCDLSDFEYVMRLYRDQRKYLEQT
jgi:hypothetical protein